MPKERVLVTGGAGFIGSNLIHNLVNNFDCEITVIDNLLSGRITNISDCPDINFIEADICDFDFSLLKNQDKIYHLACLASPPQYQKNSIQTLDTCYIGTKNVLNFAMKCGAPLLFSSTSEVYGDPLVHPQAEGYFGNVSTLTPRACYDEGKRIAETLCYEYSDRVEVKIARIFNTYGPGMCPEDGRIISNFINQALNGKPLTIYGDGSQTRSLCYVSDTVKGLMKYMERDCGPINVINIGHDNELTVSEIAGVIQRLLGRPEEIEYYPLPEADPKQRKADISKAKELLDWMPCTDLEGGLLKTIDYFMKCQIQTREVS
ncbi:NAD-dependent epimerase/dehydratase family protein [Amphritea sp.]|uniref:NAD-dependent epimerase/dehydratase family protein n=1 Tax=Amphritea sp. TaxID=1872502 RepID=UPI003D0C7090